MRLIVALLYVASVFPLFFNVGAATDTELQKADFDISSCRKAHEYIEWNTKTPLSFTFDGATFAPLMDKLERVRNFRQLRELLSLIPTALSYTFSDVLFTLTDISTGKHIPASSQDVEGFVSSSYESFAEHLNKSDSWSEVVKRTVLFAMDPGGIVSNAGAAAQRLAEDGVTQLIEQTGIAPFIEFIGVNQTLIDTMKHNLASTLHDAHVQHAILTLSPYHRQYALLKWNGPQTTFRVSCSVHPVALRYPIRAFLGLLLFKGAPVLAQSTTLYYGSGALLTSVFSLLILIFVLYKNRHNKLVIAGGLSAFVYGLFQSHVGNINSSTITSTDRLIEHQLGLQEGFLSWIFVVYVLVAAVAGGLYLYVKGPIENPRLLNVIEAFYRLAGLALLYSGTASSVTSWLLVGAAIIVRFAGGRAADIIFWLASYNTGLSYVVHAAAGLIRLVTCNLFCRHRGAARIPDETPAAADARPTPRPMRGEYDGREHRISNLQTPDRRSQSFSVPRTGGNSVPRNVGLGSRPWYPREQQQFAAGFASRSDYGSGTRYPPRASFTQSMHGGRESSQAIISQPAWRAPDSVDRRAHATSAQRQVPGPQRSELDVGAASPNADSEEEVSYQGGDGYPSESEHYEDGDVIGDDLDDELPDDAIDVDEEQSDNEEEGSDGLSEGDAVSDNEEDIAQNDAEEEEDINSWQPHGSVDEGDEEDDINTWQPAPAPPTVSGHKRGRVQEAARTAPSAPEAGSWRQKRARHT